MELIGVAAQLYARYVIALILAGSVVALVCWIVALARGFWQRL